MRKVLLLLTVLSIKMQGMGAAMDRSMGSMGTCAMASMMGTGMGGMAGGGMTTGRCVHDADGSYTMLP